MKRLIILSIAFAFLCAIQSKANVETYISRLQGENIVANKALVVEDGWYNYMQTHLNDDRWYDYQTTPQVFYGRHFANMNASGRVALQYTGSKNRYFSASWTLTVEYAVKAYNSHGKKFYEGTDELTINYSTDAQFIDHAVKEYSKGNDKAHKLEIKITAVNGIPTGLSSLPDDFILESYIEVDRYFILDPTVAPEVEHDITDMTAEIRWEFVEGAVEYELQFVHVSDQLVVPEGEDIEDVIEEYKDFRNATRVFVPEQVFKINLAYESGRLFYRVRAIGRHGDNFQEKMLGEWSPEGKIVISDEDGGEVSPYEDDLNWTYQITHAEFGKRAEVVSFFDGIGQSRQSVTKDNTTNIAVVAESMMDFEGRPAVSIVPSPVIPEDDLALGSALKFYDSFTLAEDDDTPFNKYDFDKDSNRDAPTGISSILEKAGNFYSTESTLLTYGQMDFGMNQNIASATLATGESFAYTRMLYDNQGRVREQSGIGADHKIGSGHTTQYFYGNVGQEKLDRLFGVEAGYSEHYRKKMVKDPNGQLSVSYENLSGQVIATAYVGYAPYNQGEESLMTDMLVDPSTDSEGVPDHDNEEDWNENLMGFTTETLNNGYNASKNQWDITHSLLVSSEGTYTFNYKIDLKDLKVTMCDGDYPCQYELNIKIIDPNGALVDFSGTITKTLDDIQFSLPIERSAFPTVFVYEEATYDLHYVISVSAVFNDIGTYTIIKELKIHDPASTEASFLLDISDMNSNPCGFDLPEEAPCVIIPEIGDETVADGEECDALEATLRDDMSPGGQYYDNLADGNQDPNNDWLMRDVDRNVPNPLEYHFPPSNTHTLAEELITLLGELQLPDLTSGQTQTYEFEGTDAEAEAEYWNTIRTYYEYPQIRDYYQGLDIWRFHPEFPHLVWCRDIETNAVGNGEFNNSLSNYTYANSSPQNWVTSVKACSSSPATHDIVDDDPYFASSMGDRVVNGSGLTGREVMNTFICQFPVEGGNYKTMWEIAEENADEIAAQNTPPTTVTDAEIWNEFVSIYLAAKSLTIKLQKKNPCDNELYSPYLYDRNDSDHPLDFIADCPPGDAGAHIWGPHFNCFGSHPSGIHPAYEDWWDDCDQVALSATALVELNWLLRSDTETNGGGDWGPLGSGTPPICGNYDSGDCKNDDIFVILHTRAQGFIIRVPDLEQDLTDPNDELDGFLGALNDNSTTENVVTTIVNAYDPCGKLDAFLKFTDAVFDTPLTGSFIIDATPSTLPYDEYGDDQANFWNLQGALYLMNGEVCSGSPLETSFQINTTPSCTLPTENQSKLYYSFPDFYYDNIPYFDCLVDAINSNVTSPDFYAEHGPQGVTIKSNDFLPEGSVISSLTSCDRCTDAEQQSTNTCYYIKSPCDIIIPHCACENYFAAVAALDNPINEEETLLSLYQQTYNPSMTQSSIDLLETNCKLIYKIDPTDPTDDEIDEALDEVIADAAENGYDCIAPDPCEEGGNIGTFNSQLTYEQQVQQQYQAFQAAYASTCMNPKVAPDSMTVRYKDLEYDFTLYYYTPDGSLYATVPPEGVTPLPNDIDIFAAIKYERDRSTATAPTLPTDYPDLVPIHRRSTATSLDNQLMTIYEYDSYGSVVKTTVPDHNAPGSDDYGSTQYLYDDLGRIRFSMNPKQAAEDKVSYTKYDDLGRTVESGEMSWSDNTFNSVLPGLVNVAEFPDEATQAIEEYVRTQYDSPVSISNFSSPQHFLRNRVASTSYFETEGVLSHATHYDYNVRGDVVTAWQHDPTILDPKGRVKRLDYEFGLVDGLVYAMHYQKGKLDALSHFYDYDANGRLTRTCTASDDGYIEDQDSRLLYRYDGILGREELGQYKVQGIDYAYTIHGWIKGVNSTTFGDGRDIGMDGDATEPTSSFAAHKWVARDAFGYALHYYEGDHQPINGAAADERFYAELSASDGIFDGFGAPSDAPVSSMFNGNIAAMQTAIVGTDGDPMDLIVRGYRYDQKMRLKNAYTKKTASLPSNSWSGISATDQYKSSYAYDKNGNLENLTCYDGSSGGALIDDLTYNYSKNNPDPAHSGYDRIIRNRLLSVSDAESGTDGLPSGQGTDNYEYDNIGNLMADEQEEIAEVKWLVTGKVKEVVHTSSSNHPDVEYRYDSQGNRIEKIVKPRTGSGLEPQSKWTSTLYVRTPQGEVVATYERSYKYSSSTVPGYTRFDNDALPAIGETGPGERDLDDDLVSSYAAPNGPVSTVPSTLSLMNLGSSGSKQAEVIALKELHLYGSHRLGLESKNRIVNLTFFSDDGTNEDTGKFIDQEVTYLTNITPLYRYQHRMLGRKYYELANHLGNVLAVVTDRKLPGDHTGTSVDYYAAQVIKATDYYPFGMEMGGVRSQSTDLYRYGFNGKENDRGEWGEQLVQDYGFRLYNPAVGRFLSVDPLAPEFPWNSTYAFAENDVIRSIDLDGAEKLVQTMKASGDCDNVCINVTSEEMPKYEGQIRFGHGRQYTDKELVARGFVTSRPEWPQNGTFTFMEFEDAGHYSAVYTDGAFSHTFSQSEVDNMYAQVGVIKNDFGNGLNVTAASLNLAGAGVLYKAEFKALATELKGQLGELKAPARAILPGEDIPLTQGKQTRVIGEGRFNNTVKGEYNDPSTKYIWTIDEAGLNIGLEQTAIGSNSVIKHSNLSPKAYSGGEVWFTGEKTVHINAWSGRFGAGAGMSTEAWNASAKIWESQGYKVVVEPYTPK